MAGKGRSMQVSGQVASEVVRHGAVNFSDSSCSCIVAKFGYILSQRDF